ncbi:MAG: hypothetical protein M1812_004000 [Candelaria pacifica]|nr:MAG: hypothetical protein M1812_004000 [Candelaria pacifica]
MKLSSTQSNLIGSFGNLGMYASGIPIGMLVDAKGPRPGGLIGALCLGLGYYPIHKAYDGGSGSVHIVLLCIFSTLTGIGSCSAFAASIKTAALNWPHHRGTATAFPLAAFGLSAFFFSTLYHYAFPGDTSNFLFLLAVGTFTLVFVSLFFLRVVPHTAYSAKPNQGLRPRASSNQLIRTKSEESRQTMEQLPSGHSRTSSPAAQHRRRHSEDQADETSSLMSKSSVSSPGDIAFERSDSKYDGVYAPHVDIRGRALLPKPEFWQQFLLLGLLTGVGLMTINNIGNDAQALWSHYDDSASPAFIQGRQLFHVSILSVMSCTGRFISGVGSDILVKRLGMSRFWCIVASGFIFCAAQLCAIQIENPQHLWAVSGLTGFGYGVLFGVYPSLVSDTFGVHGLSQNWGTMTIAPIVSGNIFNLIYGAIYDHHSILLPGGERNCPEGLKCYSSAYWLTFGGSVLGVAISLWSVRHEYVKKARWLREGREV